MQCAMGAEKEKETGCSEAKTTDQQESPGYVDTLL